MISAVKYEAQQELAKNKYYHSTLSLFTEIRDNCYLLADVHTGLSNIDEIM